MAREWYVAPALKQFRKETDARWPKRQRLSDGFIGDPDHASRDSQHNPNERGSVNAADTDKTGIDPYVLVNAAIKDSRTWYVIYDETIWSRTNNFKPERYFGKNKHKQHVHISIRTGAVYENDSSPWGIFVESTPTIQELSVADIAKIETELAELRKEVKYIKDQLRSIADNTYSRKALDEQTARMVAAVTKAASKA